MSHHKYITGSGKERWSIDRESLYFCVRTKCPHLSFGTCLKPRCILKKNTKEKSYVSNNKSNVTVINFVHSD
jgi:hypothetical protein